MRRSLGSHSVGTGRERHRPIFFGSAGQPAVCGCGPERAACTGLDPLPAELSQSCRALWAQAVLSLSVLLLSNSISRALKSASN